MNSITPNFHVSLSCQRSTTVHLETIILFVRNNRPFLLLSKMRMRKYHLFCASEKQHVPYGTQYDLNKEPCNSYSLRKMVSLGQKLKMLKT